LSKPLSGLSKSSPVTHELIVRVRHDIFFVFATLVYSTNFDVSGFENGAPSPGDDDAGSDGSSQPSLGDQAAYQAALIGFSTPASVHQQTPGPSGKGRIQSSSPAHRRQANLLPQGLGIPVGPSSHHVGDPGGGFGSLGGGGFGSPGGGDLGGPDGSGYGGAGIGGSRSWW
jgi:hypothetical protein